MMGACKSCGEPLRFVLDEESVLGFLLFVCRNDKDEDCATLNLLDFLGEEIASVYDDPAASMPHAPYWRVLAAHLSRAADLLLSAACYAEAADQAKSFCIPARSDPRRRSPDTS